MMRYSEENERLADKSACAGVRADLKMCLLESECCQKVYFDNPCICDTPKKFMKYFLQYKKTPRECLKATDGTVPSECQALRYTFFECKRSIVSI